MLLYKQQIQVNVLQVIVYGVVKDIYVMIKNVQIMQVNMIVDKFHFVNGINISILFYYY